MAMALILTCAVLSATDGDTVRARCDGIEQVVVIRLAEIDAPERGQPFSAKGTEALRDLCVGQPATAAVTTHDRYGRSVARVSCGGVDVNAALVKLGLAWAFTKYLTDPAIAQLEQKARVQRAGLWADDHPIAPWEWRKQKATPK